jgi:hypothetical protein
MILERNIYRIILLIAVVYILLLHMCGKKCENSVTTRVIRDTTYIVKRDTVKRYVPQVTAEIMPVHILLRDSVMVFKDVDTSAILRDYFTTRYYRDSTITQYGQVTVMDSVRENRIVSRSWLTAFKIPHIKETITEKKRNQVYAGFSALSGQRAIGAELNLSLKTKKDQVYEVGAGLFGTQWYGRIGTKFKITFK